MLARCLPGILPPLSEQERIEVSRIYSVAGDGSRPPMSSIRPFRAPHHSASDVAIIGGGSVPKPGEVSRAHLGVLFLDELGEFSRSVLEVLRQPLEDGRVCIARASESIVFPARFQLVAAMNPCPCGYYDHPSRPCTCSPAQVRRYRTRVSGPLLDRFDLQVHVPPVDQDELAHMKPGEPSKSIAARVAHARKLQCARLGEGRCNASMQPKEVEAHARPDEEGMRLLQRSAQRFGLSGRVFHRILKVARTIADLHGEDQVRACHVAEALHFRFDTETG